MTSIVVSADLHPSLSPYVWHYMVNECDSDTGSWSLVTVNDVSPAGGLDFFWDDFGTACGMGVVVITRAASLRREFACPPTVGPVMLPPLP